VSGTSPVELEAELKELIVTECDQDIAPEAIASDVALIDKGLGLDSLDALQICMAVQHRYGARIHSGADARKALVNVTSLAAAVAERRTDTGP